jgi:hypothetical protein
MLRGLVEEALLFLLPFAAFGTWLVLTRRNPFDIEHWSGRKFLLTVIGLVLAIASVVIVGLMSEPHRGAYVPPHMENGQLVPGRFLE